MAKIAINGFGRIGRQILKIALKKKINIVAINDLTDTKTLAYLLEHDSIYGKFEGKVKAKKNSLVINGKEILVFNEKDPAKLPWKKLKVDYVIEATGMFTDKADIHLKAGAKKVILTAPGKSSQITVVPGVNDNKLKKSHKIISVASCTTNALAPVAHTLDKEFGIKKGFMTTVHAYTVSQKILDGPHKKLRRGRAAGINIVPTTSGATTAVEQVIPKLKGKLNGLAMRVPVADGSIVDFVVELKKKTSTEMINGVLRKYSKSKLKGIIQYTDDEIVSTDIIGNPSSGIIDGLSTMTIGNMAKVLIWYDNEYGYSARVIDVIKKLK